jgi:hypothetical protein
MQCTWKGTQDRTYIRARKNKREKKAMPLSDDMGTRSCFWSMQLDFFFCGSGRQCCSSAQKGKMFLLLVEYIMSIYVLIYLGKEAYADRMLHVVGKPLSWKMLRCCVDEPTINLFHLTCSPAIFSYLTLGQVSSILN